MRVLLMLVLAALAGATLAAVYWLRAASDTPVDSGRARLAPPARLVPAGERAELAAPNIYAATTAGELAEVVAQITPRVYVPNTTTNDLDIIEPVSGRRLGRVKVGVTPHHVTPSWDLKRLYVDNTIGNSLTEIDPATGKVVRTIPVRDPYNLYFTPDGTKAIVVAERFQRLDFRNPHTWKMIKSLPLPGVGADHLDFSADGRSLLISDEFSGHVVRVNVVAMKVTGVTKVGGLPVDVKLSPDGTTYYVANQALHGVTMIDARTLRKRGFIATGRGAHGFSISRNTRRLYVSNRLDGSVSVISFARRKVVATWRVGGSPDMLQLSGDGKELWVSNRFGNTVSVIDAASGRVRRSIRVGSNPHGLAFFPQPGRYSVGHNGVYR